jgi:hypothetical protein
MPSITDKPLFGGNGPPEYSSVLEPAWNDEEARQLGKFPEANFPVLHKLKRFVATEPEVSASYIEKPHREFINILVQLSIEHAANMHFLKFGEGPSTRKSRLVILQPIVAGLINDRLAIAVIVPIALTRFDFERVRLANDAILIRMSEGFQRARWEGKARGANGHDAVLAAATHALVLTDWSIPNGAKLNLGEYLSRPAPQITEVIDSFFAALRLELGIETGYAQEIRLSRGWRTQYRLGDPEVYAVGARRYPTRFDDFGWTSENLPTVNRAGVEAAAKTWRALRSVEDSGLKLALRRLNTAMTRDDPVDTVLDATIALEVLLGDGDGQSIAWKLRMRAAAIIGIDADNTKIEEVRKAIGKTYDARSAIVHGGKSRRSADSHDQHKAAQIALDTLRSVIKQLVAYPDYLDPLRIDSELLLKSGVSADTADTSVGGKHNEGAVGQRP